MKEIGTVRYKRWNCRVYLSYYTTNNRKALVANDADDGHPVASFTVNIVDHPLGEDEVIIDTNNCGFEAVTALTDAGIIGTSTGTARSGFCIYPVHKLLV